MGAAKTTIQKSVKPASPSPSPSKAKQENAKVWGINAFFVGIIHALALYACVALAPTNAMLLVILVQYQMAMFGIGVGYHRLWSHRAFEASWPLRFVLMIWGTFGLQGSIKWWVLRHRLHHRYTDTEHDPYNAKRGFWFSHIGWIFSRPDYPRMKLVDASDLNADPFVKFQHTYFAPLAVFLNFVLPTAIGKYYLGETGWTSFLYLAMVPRVIIWHVTFCINSFAHLVGNADYSTETTAKGNLLLAILTSGEGWHSFHHAFPHDYRNGYRWYQYDLSKWFIFTCSFLGLTRKLHRVDDNEVEKARLSVIEHHLQEEKDTLNWGEKELPDYTMGQVKLETADTVAKIRLAREQGSPVQVDSKDRFWMVVGGKILNVDKFRLEHPGGKALIDAYIGKDATKVFYDGILTTHSAAARRLVDMLAIGHLSDRALIESRIRMLE